MIDFQACHEVGNALLVDLCDRPCTDFTAIPHDSDALCYLYDLVEPMGDEDDRDSVGLEARNNCKQPVDLGACERGRRLVHENQPCLCGESACYGDDLTFRYRQIGDDSGEVEIEFEALQHIARDLAQEPESNWR